MRRSPGCWTASSRVRARCVGARDRPAAAWRLASHALLVTQAVVGALGSEDTHQAGTFAKAWLARLADCAWVEAVNVASGLADALAVKDAAEQVRAGTIASRCWPQRFTWCVRARRGQTLVKKSAQATQSVMRKFVRRMKDVVNEEQEAKHSELAQMLEDNFAKCVPAPLPLPHSRSLFAPGRACVGCRLEVDAALPPVVQSGAKLDFGNNVERCVAP